MALCTHGGRRQSISTPVTLCLHSLADACPVGDIDAPIVHQSASGTAAASGPDPSPEQISTFVDMGFSHAQARKALRETVCFNLPVVLSPNHWPLTCRRVETQSAPLSGSSHILMTRARKKAPLLITAAAVRLKPIELQQPPRSLAPLRCRRVIACGHSSRTRGPRSIRATTSRTSARRGTAGCSSTTRKWSGLTRRAYVRSSLWRICMCLKERGLEKLEETGRKTECILRTLTE